MGVKRAEVQEEERFFFQKAEGRRRSGGLAIRVTPHSFQHVNMTSYGSVAEKHNSSDLRKLLMEDENKPGRIWSKETKQRADGVMTD